MAPLSPGPAAPASADVRVVECADPEATRALGLALGRVARRGDLVALIGELGAGKTLLAKGFGAGIGVRATINSPSFVLMAEYAGRLPLFHLDLYRLAGPGDALAGGLIDDRQAEGVTIVEWAERLGSSLPADRLEIRMDGTGDEPRRVTLTACGRHHRRYLEAVG